MKGNESRHGVVAVLGRIALFLMFMAFPTRLSAEDCDIPALMERYAAITAEAEDLLAIPSEQRVAHRYAPEAGSRAISRQGNAAVTVGGDFRATYAGVRSTTVEKPGDLVDRETVKARTGDLSITKATLLVDAEIGDHWRAHFAFNLDGHSGPHRIRERRNLGKGEYPFASEADDGNLGEAYIEYLKGGHSGFGFKIGRFNLPFGLRSRRDNFVQSYLDAPDFTGSYLMHPFAWENSPRLPHASKFLDPSLAAMATYEMRDIIQFFAATFIDDPERDGRGVSYRGGRQESDDPGLRSYLVGATFLPLEDWELSLGFRNRYNRNRGIDYWANSPYRTDFEGNEALGGVDPRWDAAANGQWSDGGSGPAFGATKNEQAFFVGAMAEIPNTKLAASLEYAHGWNQGFNKYVSSDSVNLGLSYRLFPRLALLGDGEWLRVRDRTWMTESASGEWVRDTRRNDLYRLHLGFEYEMRDGLTIEGGYQYEYWRLRSRKGGNGNSTSQSLDAAMVYFGTRFLF